jgi:hypothetical protein
MTSMSPGPGRSRPAAENDVYTALLCVAFLSVLIATVYVGYRALSMFGTLLPPGGA